METAGHIIGYIAIVESVLIFLSTKRERILILKLISEVLWLLNMAFLGLYTGVLLNMVNIARSSVFYQRGKRAWADKPVWFFAFFFATALSPIFTWEGPISIIPTAGTLCSVLGYYNKRPLLIRFFAFPAYTAWLIYAILTQNTSSIICNILSLTSALIGTIRQLYLERKQYADEKNA